MRARSQLFLDSDGQERVTVDVVGSPLGDSDPNRVQPSRLRALGC
jgi:hypothetical protein